MARCKATAASVCGVWRSTVMLAASLALAGCGTTSRNVSQSIHIGSQPDGAECELSRQGQSLGKVTTPAPITVNRGGKEPIEVVCTKQGYQEGRGLLTIVPVESPSPSMAIDLFAVAYLVEKANRPEDLYRSSVTVPLRSLGAATPATAPGSELEGHYAGSASIGTSTVLAVTLQVAAGIGKGSINQAGCAYSGELDLAIDSSGMVTGTAKGPLAAGCAVRTAAVSGKVYAGTMRVSLRAENGGVETLALSRKLK
jgi:hypothetical protein